MSEEGPEMGLSTAQNTVQENVPLQEFVREYGTKSAGLLIREFIARAPEFAGDRELAKEIGRMLGMLAPAFEQAAQELKRKPA